jgi:ectoine hydroxylase-related dioxygenase (phytanoyl-CoA dioxygenase family)
MPTIERLARPAPALAVLAALERDGAVILERYLEADDVAGKKADLERILAAVPTGRNAFEGFATQRVYALFAKTRSFDETAIDPLVLEVAEGVLGENFLLSAPTGIRIGPGEAAQALHRDDNVYPLPRPHPELVLNSMWALDDFTEENGATRVVAGSHRRPDLVPSEPTVTVCAAMPAGSVLFWLGSVVHGGGSNLTARPRLGVLLEYCAGWLRPQENHLLAVPRQIVPRLPERLRELLGYNVHGTLLGNVDGRHPRKYVNDQRRVRDGVLDLSRSSDATR